MYLWTCTSRIESEFLFEEGLFAFRSWDERIGFF